MSADTETLTEKGLSQGVELGHSCKAKNAPSPFLKWRSKATPLGGWYIAPSCGWMMTSIEEARLCFF